MTNPFWLIVAASLIALLPIVIGLLTSYIKVSVVLGMLRSGIGAQQVPSGLIIMALSLAMTLYIMAPVIDETFLLTSQTELPAAGSMPTIESLKKLVPLTVPWKAFMQKHAGHREILVLQALADDSPSDETKIAAPHSETTSLRVLIPAFVLTEIKEGFAMGFVLLLPFLAIDLIVANILAGMGMYMLSPVMISLPLKLILFVAADGWILLTKGLITSYAT